MTDYAAGTPSWVELSTADADGSFAFYSGLFGWDATEGSEQFGGYRNWLDDGQMVGGLNPMGEHPVWTVYVATDDADATTAKVTEHGGSVIAPPMDVGDLGRLAVFQDPAGAVFGVWQAGTHKGAEKVNAPVSVVWNDLNTRDLDGAKAFYAAVFGWDPVDQDMGGGSPYTVWELGGRGIGGAVGLPAQVPAEIPDRWVTWFAVTDRDATVARAGELGATVLESALDVPGVGKMGVLTDPQGAFFGVLEPETADE